MAHINLSHVNFKPQVKPQATQATQATPKPIKKGEREREGGMPKTPHNSHEDWVRTFLKGGEYILIPVTKEKQKQGFPSHIKIPRAEIVGQMAYLYTFRTILDPNEDQTGIYEEAKRMCVAEHLRKLGIKKSKPKSKGSKTPRPSWVNPKYR